MIEAELKMPADKRMQVVSIVTPNALHYPFAKKLLDKRIPPGLRETDDDDSRRSC